MYPQRVKMHAQDAKPTAQKMEPSDPPRHRQPPDLFHTPPSQPLPYTHSTSPRFLSESRNHPQYPRTAPVLSQYPGQPGSASGSFAGLAGGSLGPLGAGTVRREALKRVGGKRTAVEVLGMPENKSSRMRLYPQAGVMIQPHQPYLYPQALTQLADAKSSVSPANTPHLMQPQLQPYAVTNAVTTALSRPVANRLAPTVTGGMVNSGVPMSSGVGAMGPRGNPVTMGFQHTSSAMANPALGTLWGSGVGYPNRPGETNQGGVEFRTSEAEKLVMITEPRLMWAIDSARLPIQGYLIERKVFEVAKDYLQNSGVPSSSFQSNPAWMRNGLVRLDRATATVSKKYRCTYCSKPFASKSELQRHVRVHTGERPYECSVCMARFKQKSHMKDHMRRVHNSEKQIGGALRQSLNEDLKMNPINSSLNKPNPVPEKRPNLVPEKSPSGDTIPSLQTEGENKAAVQDEMISTDLDPDAR